MPRTYTLLQIRTRCRQRADMVGSDFITDAEFNALIDEAYTELCDILIENDLNRFESTATITTTGVASYALPSDHYRTLGVDYRVDATPRYCRIPELPFEERDRYDFIQGGGWAQGWRLSGSNLVLYPTPPSGQVYRHLYAPVPGDLSAAADATAIDGVAGWEAFIIVVAAKKAMAKEKAVDPELIREEMELRERIAVAAQSRSLPERVADVNRDGMDVPIWKGWG